jgi:GWxTD domain-containing protein
MKIRKPGFILFILVLTLSLSSLYGGQKLKKKDLAPRYQEWLELTQYIMYAEEREVFMQLTSDRERDIFIDTFWKQRDPTPGTPQNEFKDEHLKRFAYANKWFSRGTSRPGWMTDMGRIHIILGEPISKDRYPSNIGLYPCEIWSYYGDPAKGLPNHFALVFFQRQGVGEYKLYDPVADGPASLLIQGRQMDPMDYESLYHEIRELAPALALSVLSLIPGEFNYGFQPNPRNAIILADIMNSPKKNVNPSYSTHFLNLRGVVDTEYLTNYVESTTDIAFIQDPITGINFLHFSMAPSKVSIDFYEPTEQYFCNYTVTVSLRDGETTIFQYDREFPIYFSEDEKKRTEANGLSLEDSFPVVDGRYELNILLQNSVGKEFSLCERQIVVDKAAEAPHLNGPFLGYQFNEQDPNQHMPFKALAKKLLYDPKKTFSRHDEIALLFNVVNLTEELWRDGEIKMLVKGLGEKNVTEKTYTLRLANYPFRKELSIDYLLPADVLSPDYYRLTLNLVDGQGKPVDEKSTEFAIALAEGVAHPIARMKPFSLQNQFLFYYMLAEQHSKLNQVDKAEADFEKAFTMNKNFMRGVQQYAHFLLQNSKFEKSLEVAEYLKQDEKFQFDYHLIKGQANVGMGKYMQAIEDLEEGNRIYNSDTRLLNSLGFCYYKTAQRDRAVDVLSASLRLNPEQEEVQKLLAEIKKIPSDRPFS